MGMLGGVFKSLGGIIKQVAPAVLRAVAPSVKEGLMKITDGFIGGTPNTAVRATFSAAVKYFSISTGESDSTSPILSKP